jgi:Spy/CpxP family protein refolding chaperone
VKTWKVILATLVIFATGVVTGGLIVRNTQTQTAAPPPASSAPYMPHILQERFLGRMKAELNLTPEQTASLEKIFAESRERMKILWGLVDPETRREVAEVRDKIRAELRPDQREKFEALLKQRPSRRGPGGPDDRRSRGERGSSERGSNKTSSALEATNVIPDR